MGLSPSVCWWKNGKNGHGGVVNKKQPSFRCVMGQHFEAHKHFGEWWGFRFRMIQPNISDRYELHPTTLPLNAGIEAAQWPKFCGIITTVRPLYSLGFCWEVLMALVGCIARLVKWCELPMVLVKQFVHLVWGSTDKSSRKTTNKSITPWPLNGRGLLGGGFKDFYFHPYLGKIPILTNIFQMGWNHQPV